MTFRLVGYECALLSVRRGRVFLSVTGDVVVRELKDGGNDPGCEVDARLCSATAFSVSQTASFSPRVESE